MLLMKVQYGCQILATSRMQPTTRKPMRGGHQIGDTCLTGCIFY
jgi:hypothetical protein